MLCRLRVYGSRVSEHTRGIRTFRFRPSFHVIDLLHAAPLYAIRVLPAWLAAFSRQRGYYYALFAAALRHYMLMLL